MVISGLNSPNKSWFQKHRQNEKKHRTSVLTKILNTAAMKILWHSNYYNSIFNLLIKYYSTVWLQAIKNACETESFGDNLSEHIVSAADDLYHMRIPKTWCQMAGSAAPPLTMSVAAWLSGDRDRDGLLARSMALEKLIGLVCNV